MTNERPLSVRLVACCSFILILAVVPSMVLGIIMRHFDYAESAIWVPVVIATLIVGLIYYCIFGDLKEPGNYNVSIG